MYRIKRFSEVKKKWNDLNDKVSSFNAKVNKKLGFNTANQSLIDDLEGRKGTKAQKKRDLQLALAGSLEGAGIGVLSTIGSKKSALSQSGRVAATALVGAGLGYGTSKAASAIRRNSKGNLYDKQRIADSTKVGTGEMSKSEFKKKWNKKS